jgi:5-(aminomethyl)-3-furanmethanol phosphate kinase
MNATLVKVGGSLTAYPEKLKTLCIQLSEFSKKHSLIVVPGGCEFADVTRRLDKKFSLSCSVSHRMAILGMDQYGLLLSDLTPQSVTVTKLLETKRVLDSGRLPIFLPSDLFFKEDPLENSWDLTSDSIATYIASRLQASKVLLVTDVDGIYTDNPKTTPEAELIKRVSASQLMDMNKRTSVDRALPTLLLKASIDCFVVNGLYPERIAAILDGCETVCTIIKRNRS